VSDAPAASQASFCTACGTQLLPDARFCHGCGLTIGERAAAPASRPWPPALRWGLPFIGFGALIALSAIQLSREAKDDPDGTLAAMSLPGARGVAAPDISTMSPQERADRLFNRVMSLSGEGKTDSAAFFAPMAIAALESLAPLTAHGRYDIGLVALASGDFVRAAAQADTILAAHSTHLLGLVLAARAAESTGDTAAATGFRRRLLAAEAAERERALAEYADHDADIRAAVTETRGR
jgi:hypothetical protein